MENNTYDIPKIIDTASYVFGVYQKKFAQEQRHDNPKFLDNTVRYFMGRALKSSNVKIQNIQDFFDVNPKNMPTAQVYHVFISHPDGEMQHVWQGMFSVPQSNEETEPTPQTRQTLADNNVVSQLPASALRNAELMQLIDEYKQRIEKKDNRISELENEVRNLAQRALESGIAEASAKSELTAIRNSIESEKQAIRDMHQQQLLMQQKDYERQIEEARRQTAQTLQDEFDAQAEASSKELVNTLVNTASPLLQDGVSLLKDWVQMNMEEKRRNKGLLPMQPMYQQPYPYPQQQMMQPYQPQPQQQQPFVVEPSQEFTV